jgi:hypothetical protein
MLFSFLSLFCPKTAAVLPPSFPANQFASAAGYEIFCRFFGRLSTIAFACENDAFC